jgi:hypothetical protein
MQPSPTPYSGVHGDNTLLKFCSEGCKEFWLPTADSKPQLHVASCVDEPCQFQEMTGLLMTAMFRKDKGVEQFYLGVESSTECRPYLIWHIRELECQYFAHFYISEDCLPLNSVWTKQYGTGDGEFIYNHIATKRLEVKSHIRMQLNQAVKECGFEDFGSFCEQMKNSKGISFYNGESYS